MERKIRSKKQVISLPKYSYNRKKCAGKDVEKLELSFGNVKWIFYFHIQSCSLTNVEHIQLPYDPNVPFLAVCPTDMKIYLLFYVIFLFLYYLVMIHLYIRNLSLLLWSKWIRYGNNLGENKGGRNGGSVARKETGTPTLLNLYHEKDEIYSH